MGGRNLASDVSDQFGTGLSPSLCEEVTRRLPGPSPKFPEVFGKVLTKVYHVKTTKNKLEQSKKIMSTGNISSANRMSNYSVC